MKKCSDGNKFHRYRIVTKKGLGDVVLCPCQSYITKDMALGVRARCWNPNCDNIFALDSYSLDHRYQVCPACRVRGMGRLNPAQRKAIIRERQAYRDVEMKRAYEELLILKRQRTLENTACMAPHADKEALKVLDMRVQQKTGEIAKLISECDECGEVPCICDKGPWSGETE